MVLVSQLVEPLPRPYILWLARASVPEEAMSGSMAPSLSIL